MWSCEEEEEEKSERRAFVEKPMEGTFSELKGIGMAAGAGVGVESAVESELELELELELEETAPNAERDFVILGFLNSCCNEGRGDDEENEG